MPSSPNPTFVIGAFYELPTGQIAHTIGWSGPTARLSYHFDDGGGPRQIAAAACTAWIHHPDLHDFPNARDPRLPYVFDLLWDTVAIGGRLTGGRTRRRPSPGHARSAHRADRCRGGGGRRLTSQWDPVAFAARKPDMSSPPNPPSLPPTHGYDGFLAPAADLLITLSASTDIFGVPLFWNGNLFPAPTVARRVFHDPWGRIFLTDREAHDLDALREGFSLERCSLLDGRRRRLADKAAVLLDHLVGVLDAAGGGGAVGRLVYGGIIPFNHPAQAETAWNTLRGATVDLLSSQPCAIDALFDRIGRSRHEALDALARIDGTAVIAR